jgi:hypothetical protein
MAKSRKKHLIWNRVGTSLFSSEEDTNVFGSMKARAGKIKTYLAIQYRNNIVFSQAHAYWLQQYLNSFGHF